jgi:putative transcription antitermination factor YqgF
VDYGTHSVGIAISDDEGKMAFPHKVFTRFGALKAIEALVSTDNIARIVIGEPEEMRERDAQFSRRLHEFATKVRSLTGASVMFEPEAYSTFEARRPERDKKGTLSRPKRYTTHSRGRADARAAAVILQRYLERSTTNN